MKDIKVEFNITKEAWNLLLTILEHGFVEYRNTDGTYYLIDELQKYNLIESDDESWHPTLC